MVMYMEQIKIWIPSLDDGELRQMSSILTESFYSYDDNSSNDAGLWPLYEWAVCTSCKSYGMALAKRMMDGKLGKLN